MPYPCPQRIKIILTSNWVYRFYSIIVWVAKTMGVFSDFMLVCLLGSLPGMLLCNFNHVLTYTLYYGQFFFVCDKYDSKESVKVVWLLLDCDGICRDIFFSFWIKLYKYSLGLIISLDGTIRML